MLVRGRARVRWRAAIRVGLLLAPPTPLGCGDGDPTTVDWSNPDGGLCVHTALTPVGR